MMMTKERHEELNDAAERQLAVHCETLIVSESARFVQTERLQECLTEITRQAALIEELGRDKARLDWIEENCSYFGGGSGGHYTFRCSLDTECMRQAIDAALDRAREGK